MPETEGSEQRIDGPNLNAFPPALIPEAYPPVNISNSLSASALASSSASRILARSL